jgi:hypothetical protein
MMHGQKNIKSECVSMFCFSGCTGDEKDKQRVSLEGEEKYNDVFIAGSMTGKFYISATSRMQFIICVCSLRKASLITNTTPISIHLLPVRWR